VHCCSFTKGTIQRMTGSHQLRSETSVEQSWNCHGENIQMQQFQGTGLRKLPDALLDAVGAATDCRAAAVASMVAGAAAAAGAAAVAGACFGAAIAVTWRGAATPS
jgi:hypothetical protein